MSILSEILKEEYERLMATITSYTNLISGLPKGVLVVKNIGGKNYTYLQWREGKKIKSKYVKIEELASLKEEINRRKKYEREIKKMKNSKKEFEKIIRKEL